MSETHVTYKVNEQTGEALDGWDPQDPDEQGEMGLTVINPANPAEQLPSLTNLPPHFLALNLEQYPPEQRAERVLMATEYLSAPKDLVDYMNLDIEVAGAALIWHPPFTAKGSKPGDPLSPGYFNARMKLTDGTLLKSSSMNVAQALAGLLPALGWFDWPSPVMFHVSGKDGAHYISRVKKGAAKQ